jgi:hypothetical protein
MAMLYAIPALYMTLVKHALTGGEDKRNSIWEKIATDQAANVLSSIPIGREAGSWIHGQDYHGPAGLRIFSIGADAVQKMKAGHVPTREANQAAGILFHYPALQVQRMSDGVDALSEGRTVNPLAPLLGAYRR